MKYLLIFQLAFIVFLSNSHQSLAQNKKSHHFVIVLNSSLVVSGQNLRLNHGDSILLVDDSIKINIDSIKSVFHDRPGNATFETIAGTFTGAVVGLVAGAVTSEAILLASADPYYGSNAGLAFGAGLVVIGGGITAGTLIGKDLGSDKTYPFQRKSVAKRKKILKRLAKIKPN